MESERFLIPATSELWVVHVVRVRACAHTLGEALAEAV